MNALTRRFATVGSALAMAASSLLLATSPASAAESCYAAQCEGKDPAATVCQSDARTVGTTEWNVELRYSPTCRTAWARYSGGVSFALTVTVERRNGDGSYTPYYSTPYRGNGASVWTRMTNDAGYLSRACVRFDSGFSCTAPY
ncbi:DUF2690 domain-containing protein [Streptomyces sp. NPDC056169]|uniref:DUF2690 domain-containing protein n=1 Tax=Streptomyces sp. NPDC056169 TaxID=3345734 RepID=UPI0035D9CD76